MVLSDEALHAIVVEAGSRMKIREHLSASGLFRVVRSGFEKIVDTRVAELVEISLADTLMSAFAMFSLKDPSLLAFEQLRRDHPHLPLIITEDALSSNAPHIEELIQHDLHYILGVKEGDHAYLFEQVQAAHQRQQTTEVEIKGSGVTHQFRFINQIGLNQSNPDLRVNFVEYWEVSKNGNSQHFSWITDFEHNFGQGEKNLSVVFALLMMLAFLVDQTQQVACRLFQAVLSKIGCRTRMWEDIRSLFHTLPFDSMESIYRALLHGFKIEGLVILDSG